MWNLINSGLPIVPCPREGEGKRGKGERLEKSGGLGPLFQFSQAWISDAETPFLKAFKDEWASWPNGKNDDTLDSTYWMCYVAQGFLIPVEEWMGEEEKEKKSFADLAKQIMERRA